jgi:hypothetical protein
MYLFRFMQCIYQGCPPSHFQYCTGCPKQCNKIKKQKGKKEVTVNIGKEEGMILHLKNQNEYLNMPLGLVSIERSQNKSIRKGK